MDHNELLKALSKLHHGEYLQDLAVARLLLGECSTVLIAKALEIAHNNGIEEALAEMAMFHSSLQSDADSRNRALLD